MKINEEMGLHHEWYEEAEKQTMETLNEFINHLIEDYEHDYGTICHAIAAGAVATCNAMNRSNQGDITGYQVAAIMWNFIRVWTKEEGALELVRYNDMLYPQNANRFEKTIPKECAYDLINHAKKLLEEYKESQVTPIMYAHWKSIAEGKMPFGYRIQNDYMNDLKEEILDNDND